MLFLICIFFVLNTFYPQQMQRFAIYREPITKNEHSILKLFSVNYFGGD